MKIKLLKKFNNAGWKMGVFWQKKMVNFDVICDQTKKWCAGLPSLG